MKHIAVIYDREKKYAEKLAGYFNVSDIFPFETRAFYEIEEATIFCIENEVEVLIIDEDSKDLIDLGLCKEIFILSAQTNRNGDEIFIYKYQEAEKIIRQVMTFLSQSEKLGAVIARKKTMKLISFYSPVKRALSTTMAIGMGQLLGRNHRTLYVNLESYSGLTKLLNREFNKDVTDLIYFFESRSGNVGTYISGIVEQVEGVDILPPVHNQKDLIYISEERWKELLIKIEQDTDYEYVILDLSEAVQGLFDILSVSDHVVSCVDNDEVAISKIVQYEKSLIDLGYDGVLQKTRKCNVPHQHRKNGEINYLATGELGEYIKNVLKGIMNEM